MFRSILIPAGLIGLVLIPFFLPTENQKSEPDSALLLTDSATPRGPFRLASAPINSQTVPTGLAYQSPTGMAGNPANQEAFGMRDPRVGYPGQKNALDPAALPQVGQAPVYDGQGNVIGMAPIQLANQGSIPAGVPDYGAAETFALPGNAWGPDLNATPMEFVPVVNLGEIFRFEITPQWVQGRWKRVSSCPGEPGLQGLRTALVTGTNSWDLHGSLTYYFDGYQKCQRITFRGWAGDPTNLLNLLQQQFGFKQQSSQWAGFYLAKYRRNRIGGLLMKHPTVSYAENRRQQLGILLEINRPRSKHQLSEDFESLILGSQNQFQ